MPKALSGRPRDAGFTLIELMIAVAIIAMLASIALPQYQRYVARAQFAEALSLFAGLRTAIESEVQLYGAGAADNVLAGQRESGDYVAETEIDSDVSDNQVTITMTFAEEGVNAALAGEEVTFTGSGWEDGSEWDCDPASAIEDLATGICAAGSS
ncbi:MAG: pilin [Halorhodospira sp.]